MTFTALVTQALTPVGIFFRCLTSSTGGVEAHRGVRLSEGICSAWSC